MYGNLAVFDLGRVIAILKSSGAPTLCIRCTHLFKNTAAALHFKIKVNLNLSLRRYISKSKSISTYLCGATFFKSLGRVCD
jgi:hypothetical protein